MAGKVDNALDFIVDEINISEKVIGSVKDIENLIRDGEFSSSCKPLPAGDLVLALRIPTYHAAEKNHIKKTLMKEILKK